MLSGLNELKGKEVEIRYLESITAIPSKAKGVITKIAVDNTVTFIILDNGEAINTRFISKITVIN